MNEYSKVDQQSPDVAADALLKALGSRVRAARASKKLPRRILSERAGVSPRYLAQLEAGKGNISILLLYRVATALDLSLPDLLRAPGVDGEN